MLRTILALAALSAPVGAGCAAMTPPRIADDHPASASAAEGVVPPQSTILSSGSVGLAPAAEPSASNAGAIYTCPMHPEVQQTKPGECPKCGMRLVKKAASDESRDDSGKTGRGHAGHGQ